MAVLLLPSEKIKENSFMSKKDKNQEIEEIAAEEVVTQQKETVKEKKQKEDKKEEIDPVESLQHELNAERDKFLRLFAEFENYKKRTSKERIEMFKTAGREVIESMLPIMDDFDRALKEIEKSDDDDLFQGVLLINNKFRETLKSKGLKPVETQQGEVFDAEIHEAITQIPAPNEELKGKIIDVIEKGYTLGDKIIRYPKVVIGQ